MNYKNKRLQLKQVDEELKKYKKFTWERPEQGWIKTIRKTISMSAYQLSAKLGISHQALSNLEKREVEMRITMGKLREIGDAMGLKLVYGFIPKTSLEKMIEERAMELASKIVMRTSMQMAIEDQKVREKILKESIKERTEEIIKNMPENLWD